MDHLGSTSVSVDGSDVKSGVTAFRPYGETRYTTGPLPTERVAAARVTAASRPAPRCRAPA